MRCFTSLRSAHALSERICTCHTCMSEDLCVKLMLGNTSLAGI